MTKRVAIAMSGGVDSSVTALLLKKQGYDVVGITAKTTNTPSAEQVITNAKAVADMLGIEFYPLDVTAMFKDRIINYFETSYKRGETPNPCIMCNKNMKWGALFDFATKDLQADYIATGHYANIINDNGIFKLFPASDEHKDQLYFLFLLDQNHLSKTLFPLSKYKKSEVRQIAYENNLPSKSSKESQDICFIQAPMTTKKYLHDICQKQTGLFIEKNSGKILGQHNGFWQYTVGQRRGIGIAAPRPLFVTSTDAKTNTVYVGYKEDLYSDKIILRNINWSYPNTYTDFEALAKIRYNMNAVKVRVKINANSAEVTFPEKVTAVAIGQACVLYDIKDGHMLGGAFIH